MDVQDILFNNDMASRWSTLNDGVMGGLSEGQPPSPTPPCFGQAKLASKTTVVLPLCVPVGHTNLQAMKGVLIRCKGQGGPFKLTLETSERWWMPYAYASFSPSKIGRTWC